MNEAEDIFVMSAKRAFEHKGISAVIEAFGTGRTKIIEYASSTNKLFRTSAYIFASLVVFFLLPIVISGIFVKLQHTTEYTQIINIVMAIIALILINKAQKKLV